MSKIAFLVQNRPAVEIIFPTTGKKITIWPDGKVEGIDEPFVVVNHIPVHMAYHETLDDLPPDTSAKLP